MLEQNNSYWNTIQKYLGTILDMINDPVIIIDKEGTIIYINEGYELQVGVKRERLLGRNLNKRYPNDKLLQVLRKGELIKNEEHFNETLGYNVVASFLPIKDDKGETIAVAGIGNTPPVYKLNVRLSPILSISQDKQPQNITRDNLPSSFPKYSR
jgi:PAS domain S-box-containing protein